LLQFPPIRGENEKNGCDNMASYGKRGKGAEK